jgi:putative ABC transport system permease protein
VIDSLYIAWKYVCFNKIKTATLIACITLIAFLPLALQLLLDESEQQLMSRAVSTPLIAGVKGSALDLVMNTLYFVDEVPELMTMADVDRIEDSNLALPIPIHAKFQARGYPIVGTTMDYFDFRGLKIANGRSLAIVGEAVLGATVANELELKPGDFLVSSPDNPFDLAGVYPLKMHVVGILAKSHSSDDFAVFVDLKTTWIIEGLGHGHQDLLKNQDASLLLDRTEKEITANAKLRLYTEISEINLDSFHFHGDRSQYRLTASLAVPKDPKSGTLLRGRYVSQDTLIQIVQPAEVIDGLLQNIFQIKNVIDAIIVLVGIATMLAIVLIFALSLRLRQREMDTVFKLGCRRMTIARLMAAEIVLIIVFSSFLCVGFMTVVEHFKHDLVRMAFI